MLLFNFKSYNIRFCINYLELIPNTVKYWMTQKCDTLKITQNVLEGNGYTFLFLYLKLLWGILDQLKEFVLVVCGECHTNYTESSVKLLFFL